MLEESTEDFAGKARPEANTTERPVTSHHHSHDLQVRLVEGPNEKGRAEPAPVLVRNFHQGDLDPAGIDGADGVADVAGEDWERNVAVAAALAADSPLSLLHKLSVYWYEMSAKRGRTLSRLLLRI